MVHENAQGHNEKSGKKGKTKCWTKVQPVLIGLGILGMTSPVAMAACSYPYTLANSTIADATQVMADFNAAGSCTATNPIFNGSVGIGTPSTASTILELYSLQPQPLISSSYVTNTNGDWYSQLRLRSFLGAGDEYFTYDDVDLVVVRGGHSFNGDSFTHDSDLVIKTNSSNRDHAPSEVMRVTSDGYVGIGDSNPGYSLSVNGTAYATGAAGALSDIRHKQEVRALSEGALKKVMALKPVSFLWRNPKDEGMRGRQMGFIAQDVEKVLPTVVLTEDNREKTKGLKYNELVAVLTKAVQEEQGEIQELKVENEKLAQKYSLLASEKSEKRSSSRLKSAALN